jgi:hypothetical protein
MTPREFEAHINVADAEREVTLEMYANLQAALHNGPLTREDKTLWRADMFRRRKQSESKPATPQEPAWKRERDAMLGNMRRLKIVDPRATPENVQNADMLSDRERRARAANERGESREVIERILTGVA